MPSSVAPLSSTALVFAPSQRNRRRRGRRRNPFQVFVPFFPTLLLLYTFLITYNSCSYDDNSRYITVVHALNTKGTSSCSSASASTATSSHHRSLSRHQNKKQQQQQQQQHHQQQQQHQQQCHGGTQAAKKSSSLVTSFLPSSRRRNNPRVGTTATTTGTNSATVTKTTKNSNRDASARANTSIFGNPGKYQTRRGITNNRNNIKNGNVNSNDNDDSKSSDGNDDEFNSDSNSNSNDPKQKQIISRDIRSPSRSRTRRKYLRRRGRQKVKRVKAKIKRMKEMAEDKIIDVSTLNFIGDYEEDEDDHDHDHSNNGKMDRSNNKGIINMDPNDHEIDYDDEKGGKWVSSLLSDIRDRFNTDEVTERVRCESKKEYKHGNSARNDFDVVGACITRNCMNIRGGGIGIGIGISAGSIIGDRTFIRRGKSWRKRKTESSSTRSNRSLLGKKNTTSHIIHRKQKKERDENNTIFDEIGRSISLYAAVIVLMQFVNSILVHNDDALLNEIASKLLSNESAIAVKTIRDIIKNFPEHGVVDVFKEYPTKDVVMAILALSRLQRAVYVSPTTTTPSNRATEEDGTSGTDILKRVLGRINNSNDNNSGTPYSSILGNDGHAGDGDGSDDALKNDHELLADLAHYSVFAHAAYGWKIGLLSGRLHIGDLATLLRKTGIQKHDVINTNWKSKTHLPAYYLVRDVEKKKIVLCIRGTLSAKDILTDLCCTAEDFLSHEEEEKDAESFRTKLGLNYRARAHQGMVSSARSVSKKTHHLIASELESNPDYQLVLVGHSLGGGVAAVLGTLWRETFPGLSVYAYGCPCVGPMDTYPKNLNESIISVVGEGDPFSSLSLGHLADISAALSKLCVDDELRNEILNRTKTKNLDEMSVDDLRWCASTLHSLQAFDTTTEKFYPPGRVLHMRGNLFSLNNVDEVTLTEIQPEVAFRDLKLHPRMFDLSLHIPHRYEVLLSRIWCNANKKKVK